MDLTVYDDTATVTVDTDIDIATEEEWRHVLWEAVHAGPARIVLDLSAATIFGTTGVNGLLWVCELLHGTQTQIVIAGCTSLTRRVLDACRLHDVDRIVMAASA